MKIDFIVPPGKRRVPERVYGCSYQLYPQPELPMLYCASVLENSGHEALLRDFPLEANSEKDFEEYIWTSEADCFVLHSVYLSAQNDIDAARKIRTIRKDTPIIFFGPEPTRVPEEFLFDENLFIVRGEPELSFDKLIRALENGEMLNIPGISHRDDKIRHNPSFGIIDDLDCLPIPNRELIERYRNLYYNPKLNKRPYTLISTSRGCAYRCYYCVPNAISWARGLEWKRYHEGQKPPIRVRSAENVIAEFKEVAYMGYKSVWVIDDMFLWNKKRIMRICDGIENLGIEFGVLARCDFLSNDVAVALKNAGCKIVDMGVESFDQNVLDYIQKNMKVSSIQKAINILKEVGIEPEVNLMFGTSPYETKEMIEKTIQKTIALDVNYALFSIATPFPGTELCEVAKKEGWINPEKAKNIAKNYDPSEKAVMHLPNVNEKDLEQLQRYAKRRFYFRAKYVLKTLTCLRSPSQFTNLLKTAIKLWK